MKLCRGGLRRIILATTSLRRHAGRVKPSKLAALKGECELFMIPRDAIVDLRSDTLTLPTPGLRKAMAQAQVGDDVFGEDPTVNKLQERVCALLGMDASLFVPSGTMANLLAVLAQTQPGDSIILHEDAHPFNYESGNLGMVAGVMPRTASGDYGILTADNVAKLVVRSDDHHMSNTTLVAIENTTNRGGGALYPLDTIKAIRKVAHEHNMRLHMDGARLFNAVVESGVPASEYAKCCDTASFCFSKGLGAPAGSILAGNAATIDRAHRYRKMLGGGMRQAGVLAAGALYAMDHQIERLRQDHRRAKEFREALEDVKGFSFPLPSPTNIVYVDVPGAASFAQRLARRKVKVLDTGPDRIRCVFHLGIDDRGLDHAIEAFRKCAK